MTLIRIYRQLDSETLHLAELKPLIGKMVEITVREQQLPVAIPGSGDWEAAERALRELREAGTYDFNAWREQREFDLKHAQDHLP